MGPGTLMYRARTNRTLPANPAKMMASHHNCHEKSLDQQRSKTRFQLCIGMESERAATGTLLPASQLRGWKASQLSASTRKIISLKISTSQVQSGQSL